MHITEESIREFWLARPRWLLAIGLGLVLLASGVGIGALVVAVGPIPVAALILGLGYLVWILRDLEVAYWGVIGVVMLLPFASLPIQIGFKPTFLDGALLALFFAWLAPVVLNREHRWILTPMGGPVLVFLALAIAAFVAGLSHAPLTSYTLRHFAEVLLSISLFFLIVNTVRDEGRLVRLIRVLLLGAGAAAVIGIILYFIPDEWAIRALSALGRLGYPTGSGVLRFVMDDPEQMKRAVSTSIDPNVLGSLLNVTTALAVIQWFSPHPVLPRRVLAPLSGIMGLCLGLTISRGSLLGFGVAVTVAGVLRYRKVLPFLLAGVVLFLVLPWTQGYVQHFIAGVQGQDLSTQMRFGEYKDALILIGRYPILGVGFSGAPDIDTYVGVSNMYLLMAEEMGLVGLSSFLVILGTLLFRFWKRLGAARAFPRLEGIGYGLHAGIIGGLVGGMLDHYFFSLDFHNSVTFFWLLVGLAAAVTQLIDAGGGREGEPVG